MTYILKYTVKKSIFYLRKQTTLKIHLFMKNPLSCHTYNIAPEHLPRLMRCSPAPLQGQGSSSELLHFPVGKQTDWRQTVSSTLQTDTLVRAGPSLSLSTHTGAFCCLLVRGRSLTNHFIFENQQWDETPRIMAGCHTVASVNWSKYFTQTASQCKDTLSK